MNVLCLCVGERRQTVRMTTHLVTKAVEDTGIFNEVRLATIVAQYTGGVCAGYDIGHNAWTPSGEELQWPNAFNYLTTTKACRTCGRLTCLRCFWGKPTYCRECEADFCMDCHRTSTIPCLDEDCCDLCLKCAAALQLTCCDRGKKLAMCAECRKEGAYAVENVCWGCRTMLCPECANYTCRCGKMWCPECRRDRMEPACCHGEFCICAKDGTRPHVCHPRGAKRRTTHSDPQ